MDNSQILAIVGDQLSQAQTYTDLQTPLDYYLGNPNGKEVEGRSQVTSTDVADAIEWIMPQVMKAFTQSNEVVIFDPVGPEDEDQSELESRYVYDVLMKENDGFILLHQFVKDALLQKNGILKVYYDDTSCVEVLSFTGLTEHQLASALSSAGVEVIGYTQDPITGLFDVRLKFTRSTGKVKIESVPLENFYYTPNHNSISLDDAKFTAYLKTCTVSDLIEEGFDRAIIEDLQTSTYADDQSAFRFELQGESSFDPENTIDPSMRMVNVAECYLKIDLDGDGISEYCIVTVAGDITPTHVLHVEAINYCPWVATTAILMSHKFLGMSIYDRLKQIQDQKTALVRNLLDNIYLQNNQRTGVVDSQVNIDDLLVSRPGGIVRMKRPDAIVPLVTPQLSPESFTMLEYLDSVRAGRIGVAPEGEVTPQRVGENVGSQGVGMLLTAKEELVGLIVRVIAETGLKQLCCKIRDLLIRHVDAVQNYKFRGEWVIVNPADWRQRTYTTVRVGTGTGNHARKIQTLQIILQLQKEILQLPGQALVIPQKVYAALDDFIRFSELNGAAKYFVDPTSQDGQQLDQMMKQQAKQQEDFQKQLNAQMVDAQVKLSIAELQKNQVAMQNNTLKAQLEQLKQQLDLARSDAEAAHKDADRLLKKYDIDTKAALELTKIEATSKQQEEQNAIANREALSGDDSDETEED